MSERVPVGAASRRDSSFSIREVVSAESGLVPSLCALLEDSVHGGASVGFLTPLARRTAEQYWRDAFDSLGERLRLWVAEEGGAVVGCVQLAPCLKENGRHRAEIQKLLVHSAHRGRGIASALMASCSRPRTRARPAERGAASKATAVR